MGKLIKIPSVSAAFQEIRRLHKEIHDDVPQTMISKATRIGEILTGFRSGLKHGQWEKWVKANESNLSFGCVQAWRYLTVFKKRANLSSTKDLTIDQACKLLGTGKSVHVSRNSGDNEWYTPAPFVEAARAVMETIDCDPASTELANETVKAAKFYTKEQNGLKQQWNGNVWMNPPYASDSVGNFAEAVASKFESGEIQQAIVLVNNATETEWFVRIVSQSSAVCFPMARVKFLDPKGNPGAPLQGQAILYLGQKTKMFIHYFSPFGFVLCRP